MSIKLTGDLESVAEDKVVTKSQYVSGGYMVLNSESDRNNLTDAVAPVGTLVYVTDTDKIYQKTDLRSGSKPNGTWEEYSVSVDQDVINSNALNYIEQNYQYELSDSDKSYIENYIDENMPSGGGSEGGVLNGYNYNSEFENNSCAKDEMTFENNGIKETIFAAYTQQSINDHFFTEGGNGNSSNIENFIVSEGAPPSFIYDSNDEDTIICPLIVDNDNQVIDHLEFIVSDIATDIFLGPVYYLGAIACNNLENLYFCRGYVLVISGGNPNSLVFKRPVNIYVPRGSLFILEPENVRFDGNCMFHFEESENELQNYIDAGCFDNCSAEYNIDSFPSSCSSYTFISRKEISIKVKSKVDFQKDCRFDFSKEPIQTVIDKEDKKYTASFVNDEESVSLTATYNAKKFLPAYTANYTIGDKEKTIDDKIKNVNDKVVEAERDIDAINNNIAKVTDNTVILQKNLIDLIHPVGSVILTRNENFDPTQVYRDTKWIEWVDGYLKVGTAEEFADETKNSNGEHEAIGSYKITTDMLPPHTHNMYHNHTGQTKLDGGHDHQIKWDIDGDYSGSQDVIRAEQNETQWGYMFTEFGGEHVHELMIDTYNGQTGSGPGQKNDYKPKFYPVYAWERIE